MMAWMALSGAVAGAITFPLVKALTRGRLKGASATLVAAAAAIMASYLVRLWITDPMLLSIGARASAEEALQKDEVMSVLLKDHPEVREDFKELMASQLLNNATPAQARQAGVEFGQRVLGQYFGKHAARASSQSLQAWLGTSLKVLEHLRSTDVASCVSFMFGPGPSGGFDLATAVPAALGIESVNAMRAVVLSSFKHPEPAPSADEAAATLAQLGGDLLQRTPDAQEMLAALDQPHASDARRVCDAAILVYSEVASYPMERGTTVLRAMLASM